MGDFLTPTVRLVSGGPVAKAPSVYDAVRQLSHGSRIVLLIKIFEGCYRNGQLSAPVMPDTEFRWLAVTLTGYNTAEGNFFYDTKEVTDLDGFFVGEADLLDAEGVMRIPFHYAKEYANWLIP